MFKKIEIWILYLIIIFALICTLLFGVLVNIELNKNPAKRGWLSKTAFLLTELPFAFRSLIIGLSLDNRFPNQSGFEGTPSSAESYLLLSRYDGDLKESVVELVDLRSFDVLHTWNPDIDQFNSLIDQVDEFRNLERDNNNSRALLLHPKLTKDGELLFHTAALRKIGVCSNLIFQISDNNYHHSIEIDIDGNIWAPSRLYPYALPANKVGADLSSMFEDDAIVKLSADGKILFEKSISEIFIENGLEYLLFSSGDINSFIKGPTHLNDIQPVNSDGKYWNKGDVFLSLRHQSMVLLYRPSTNEIIWKGTGKYFNQHDVDILDDHRISVFNNNSKKYFSGDVVDGHNEVIIYDFETDEYSAYLQESLKKAEVRTITAGRSQILSNNDLFIEETDYGRSVYFNADGSLRWTHVNRANDDEVYHVGWSRILYNEKNLIAVENLLSSRGICDE
jgi:hypothetical protein